MQEGKQTAEISLRAEEGCMHLSYRVRGGAGEWQDIKEPVAV
jgi:hypothetical protein